MTRIKEILKEKGLTVNQLADMLETNGKEFVIHLLQICLK